MEFKKKCFCKLNLTSGPFQSKALVVAVSDVELLVRPLLFFSETESIWRTFSSKHALEALICLICLETLDVFKMVLHGINIYKL